MVMRWWFNVRLWKAETTEKAVRWLAWALPRDVALWCFVRVCAASGLEHDAIAFEKVYKAWEAETRRQW